jgi:hypothetical protein
LKQNGEAKADPAMHSYFEKNFEKKKTRANPQH